MSILFITADRDGVIIGADTRLVVKDGFRDDFHKIRVIMEDGQLSWVYGIVGRYDFGWEDLFGITEESLQRGGFAELQGEAERISQKLTGDDTFSLFCCRIKKGKPAGCYVIEGSASGIVIRILSGNVRQDFSVGIPAEEFELSDDETFNKCVKRIESKISKAIRSKDYPEIGGEAEIFTVSDGKAEWYLRKADGTDNGIDVYDDRHRYRIGDYVFLKKPTLPGAKETLEECKVTGYSDTPYGGRRYVLMTTDSGATFGNVAEEYIKGRVSDIEGK